jgi:hypothetical protein
MKTTRLTAALIAAMAMSVHAQNEEPPPGPPPGHCPPPGGPLFALLDTDRDRKLSEAEIDKAPEILKALDENGDGYVDAREAHPRPPAPKEESDSTETTSTEATSTESSSD